MITIATYFKRCALISRTTLSPMVVISVQWSCLPSSKQKRRLEPQKIRPDMLRNFWQQFFFFFETNHVKGLYNRIRFHNTICLVSKKKAKLKGYVAVELTECIRPYSKNGGRGKQVSCRLWLALNTVYIWWEKRWKSNMLLLSET